MSDRSGKLILCGNPNVGKSLVFNELTGAKQKVGNYPGVTLTHLSGSYKYNNKEWTVTDLPGLYSFNSGNFEEGIAHDFIINHDHDLIINIVDGRKLERNLFLTLQLREMGRNMMLVITFKDKLEKMKIIVHTKKLETILGIPVLLISAFDSKDSQLLRERIDEAVKSPMSITNSLLELGDYEPLIAELEAELESTVFLQPDPLIDQVPKRWVVLSILMNHRDTQNLWPVWLVNKIKKTIGERVDDYERLSVDLIAQNYQVIEELLVGTVDTSQYVEDRNHLSEKIDKVLLHPILGFILFGFIMFLVFKITFDVSEPISMWLGNMASNLADWLRISITNELLSSFLADAIVGGVGFILVFIPQIAILFLFIGIMEHSGYLSRVVFITDRFLNKLGISGTSIASLLLGFGCNVPAIMATKSIKDNNERIALVLVNPFMSCSARLPVYVIISGALFPEIAGLVIASLYFSGIIIAIFVLFVLRKTILKGETSYLLMELPELSKPPLGITLSRVLLMVRKFVENAASWMAIGIIVMWVLSIFGPGGYIGPEALSNTEKMEISWIFWIGEIFHPIFGPFGWDSRLIIALIFGFIAKEVVISSFGLIYGVSGASLNIVIISQFTMASGLAYLFFVLLYTPCIGTIFAIKQEIGGKWAWMSIVTGLIIAYVVALLVFKLGSIIF